MNASKDNDASNNAPTQSTENTPGNRPNWLSGTQVAKTLRTELKTQIETHSLKGTSPCLAVILVGDDTASHIYVNKKRQACMEVGIESELIELPSTVSENTLITKITELNARPETNGILVQLPLPDHISTQLVLETIAPNKDVDGFHAFNLGRLAQRAPMLRPCTPKGVMILLEQTGIELKGKHAVVVGASNIVGRPMALELLLAGCTTTICHRFTQDLQHHVSQADILIAAAGKPGLIKGEWIKIGAIAIDVGIHRQDDGKLIGDIEANTAEKRCEWLTPVPGGVGPMTVACLLDNTWHAYKVQNELSSAEITHPNDSAKNMHY